MAWEIRQYEERDERGWLRCRLLSFFDSAFFDAVEREKGRYEKPAIELVAEEGGEIVGLLDLECDSDGLYDRPGRGGMIWHLATHPDHQRQGIASALLHEAERQARERGLVRLEAWTRDDAHPSSAGTKAAASDGSTHTSTFTSNATTFAPSTESCDS